MTCTAQTWDGVRARLQQEIPEFAFASWIAPMAIKVSPTQISLGCPSNFHRDHVRIVYAATLERVLRETLGAASSAAKHAGAVAAEIAEAEAADVESETSEDATVAPLFSGAKFEILLLAQLADAPGVMIDNAPSEPAEVATADEAALQPTARRMRKVEAQPASVETRAVSNGPSVTADLQAVEPIQALSSSVVADGPSAFAPGPAGSAGSGGASAGADALVARGDLSSFVDKSVDTGVAPSAAPSSLSGLEVPSSASPESPKAAVLTSGPEYRARVAPAGPVHPPRGPASDQFVQAELPFSFDNFVVGPCNALAREAALALARRQQTALNLMYLGGGSGMGKTHLARATAEAARPTQRLVQQTRQAAQGYAPQSNAPRSVGQSVVYTSAEEFTTEFVTSMRNGRADSFRKRFRGATGLLVVEDIQFFSGRAKTQMELFHTVQHVLDAGGAVLLTGDRSPRELSGLDERVRAQVARGFIAELEAPDAMVRRHILRSKAAAGGVRLPEECLNLLVDASQGSVRDIEGMLIQVVTTASLLGRGIDAGLTREAIDLKTSVGTALTKKTVEVTEIVRMVATFFGKKPEALASRSRRKDVLLPRQLAMYLAHQYTEASLAEIGRALGREHPSVRNAIERIDRQVLEHAPIRYKLEALCERIERTLAARNEPAPE